MGMNSYFYVGAYVLLPKVKMTDTINITRCSKKKCKYHNGYHEGTNFCPLCGSEIEKATLTNTTYRQLTLWDLEKSFDNLNADSLFSPQEGLDFNVVVSNSSESKSGHTFSDYNNNGSIKPLNEKTIDKMKNDFHKELEKINFFTQLEKHFGLVLVVEFGTFSYYM